MTFWLFQITLCDFLQLSQSINALSYQAMSLIYRIFRIWHESKYAFLLKIEYTKNLYTKIEYRDLSKYWLFNGWIPKWFHAELQTKTMSSLQQVHTNKPRNKLMHFFRTSTWNRVSRIMTRAMQKVLIHHRLDIIKQIICS